jgi:hypothetical protein
MLDYDETPVSKEERELGKKLSRSRRNRYNATKDLYFETEPETAALRYPFDKRSIEILGLQKWRELFASDED